MQDDRLMSPRSGGDAPNFAAERVVYAHIPFKLWFLFRASSAMKPFCYRDLSVDLTTLLLAMLALR
jgi:hypothetical protein